SGQAARVRRAHLPEGRRFSDESPSQLHSQSEPPASRGWPPIRQRFTPRHHSMKPRASGAPKISDKAHELTLAKGGCARDTSRLFGGKSICVSCLGSPPFSCPARRR